MGLIIDNVQENFMLQPNNGIFILTWYDDPHDTALFALTPLLDELLATKARVPVILDKYRDQIPTWAGFDQFSQMGGDYSEYEGGVDDDFGPPDPGVGTPMAYDVGGHQVPESSSTSLSPPTPKIAPSHQMEQGHMHHTHQAYVDPYADSDPRDDHRGQ